METFTNRKGENIPVKNTYKQQITSLVLFMSELGYAFEMSPQGFGGGVFFDIDGQYKDKSSLSFNKAVRLHNGDVTLAQQLKFDCTLLEQAADCKIVGKVKMQHTRDERVIVQSHIVTLA